MRKRPRKATLKHPEYMLPYCTGIDTFPRIMGSNIQQLLNLPKAEKMEIALQIWESIPDKEKVFDLSPDQRDDLKIRRAKHKENPNRGKPWAVVEAGVRAELEKRSNN